MNTVIFEQDHALSGLRVKAEQAAAVSFDFFDTLFVRPLLDPEDVFDILGARFDIPDFRELRKQAQAGAFRNMVKDGRKEITLENIYACFPPQKVPAQTLMQAEYELELELVFPNAELAPLFVELCDAGKPVVITSDMYLPSRFFEQALARFDLPAVPVFVSADCNATKRDAGELFEQVVAYLQVEPERILHVGDNAVSDVVRANDKGLPSHHYGEQRSPVVTGVKTPSASLAAGLFREVAGELEPGSFRELGFAYGGPAALGFLDWVVEQAKRDRVEQVLFLSRDGYVLERMAKTLPAGSLPDFCYFKGSRIAFSMAAITEHNFAGFVPFLLSGAEGLTPAELFLRVGVTPPDEKVMADVKLGSDVRVHAGLMPELSKLLFAWRHEILKVCRENRRGLLTSLLECGIKPGSRIALVDVGWSGTTQDTFEQAMAQLFEVTVFGYYFCLANTPERLARQQQRRMKALLAAPAVDARLIDAVYQNRVAAELFFSAPHQTVIGLERDRQGRVQAREDSRLPADALAQENQALAEGAMLFADRYRTLCERIGFRPSPAELAEPLVSFMTGQRWQEHSGIAAMQNFDGWSYTVNHDARLDSY